MKRRRRRDAPDLEAVIRAIPSVDEIERLLNGNCHHGMAVASCKSCAPERIFEAMMVNFAPAVGATEEQARAMAALASLEARNPQCSHVGCSRRAEFVGLMQFTLLGAGEASGEYQAEFGGDSPQDGGGLCGPHRTEFSVERGASTFASSICAALGIELPSSATWECSINWKPITPEVA